MKVLHIVAGDLNEGAARGACWLHLGLKELGVHSKILTTSRNTFGDSSIITVIQSKKDKVLEIFRIGSDDFLPLFYPKRKRFLFSSGIFGLDFTKTKEYKESDIIHLHWINRSFVNMKHLSKVEKPIVWTMRDMWPFTGGCHYSLHCLNFVTGCGNCEQLQSSRSYDLSKFILNRKKKYLPQSVKIVGISRWLSNEAKKSELFRNFDVRTISNNINTKDFFPIDKLVAKRILGITADKKIILAGSNCLHDFYKGFDKYLDAIGNLQREKYFLCFFGNVERKVLEKLNFEYKSFGFLHDAVSLRLLYSAADVFVAPSIMDAFGKTIAEAMACGTPSVCFDATGPKDIVTHKVDGYKAEAFKTEDLSNGIEWVINNKNYPELCKKAREKILKEFDNIVIAKKYRELYEGIQKTG